MIAVYFEKKSRGIKEPNPLRSITKANLNRHLSAQEGEAIVNNGQRCSVNSAWKQKLLLKRID